MSEAENIEESLQDGKTGSPEEVNNELPKVNEEINKSQTQNMEVHHHPDLHHKPKLWKEYFLEFLMIFLAVTMGFFAESVRENISNKEHAKLLTKRLVKDMESDTLQLRKAIGVEQQQLRTIDTLYLELQKPLASANTKALQQLIYNTYEIKLFFPSTGAMSAIEKEFNIKQFANSELPGLMAHYKSDASLNEKAQNLVFRMGEENLESFMYSHFMPDNAYNVFAKDSLVIDSKMRNLTQDNMMDLSIRIETMGGIISGLISNEKNLKGQAENIIKYSIKQYHLENE